MWTRIHLCWLTLYCLVAIALSQVTQDATSAAPDAQVTKDSGSLLVSTGPPQTVTEADTNTQAGPESETTEQIVVLPGSIPKFTLAPGDVVITGGDTGGDIIDGVTKAAGTERDTNVSPTAVSDNEGTTAVGLDTTQIQEEPEITTAVSVEPVTDAVTAPTESQTSSVLPPVDGVGTTLGTEVTTGGVTEPAEGDLTTGQILTTARTWPEDDPCHPTQHKILEQDGRHFSRRGAEGTEPMSDSELREGWYAFDYQDQRAIITPTCIKETQCSTIMTYHIETDPSPEVGETLSAVMCGPGKVAGEINCCLKPVDIEVRNCQTHYVYFLRKVNLISASICIQLPNEVVPPEFLAIPPEQATTPIIETTQRPTLPWVEHENDDQGIVTVEYKFPKDKQDSNYLIEEFDLKFRKMIADALNNMTNVKEAVPTEVICESDPIPGGEGVEKPTPDQIGPEVPDVDKDAGVKGPEDMRKRRDTGDYVYTKDDVKYVGMTPTVTDDILQVPIYVEDPETGRVPTDRMMTAMKNLEDSGEISDDVGVEMVRYYEGLPQGVAPIGRQTDDDMWDRNRDLLIALIVLISLCLLIIIIGLCCLKCRKNRGSWTRADDKVSMEAGHCGKRRPMGVDNPIPQAEIMRDEAPMIERDNPAMTSNGGGGHLSKKDDDNGWVVPIEELSKAEKEKPEVEDTKL